MREIFNEGRICGLSAWELYARYALSRNPNAKILNEQQWLSASLSSNMSMILRIPGGTERGVYDFKLPEGSELCGCSTIYGSVFEGEPVYGDDGFWAIRIEDYGRLVRNDLQVHPLTPGEPQDVPMKDNPIDIDETLWQRCRDYMKVTGALMFQPGDWVDTTYWEQLTNETGQGLVTQHNEPLLAPMRDWIAAKNLEPDMAKTGFIRIAVAETIYEDLPILFQGFSYKNLVAGEVGYSYVPDVGAPESGGFLGPASFPWACKVVLVTTTEVVRSLISGPNPPIPTPVPDWVHVWNPEWKNP